MKLIWLFGLLIIMRKESKKQLEIVECKDCIHMKNCFMQVFVEDKGRFIHKDIYFCSNGEKYESEVTYGEETMQGL